MIYENNTWTPYFTKDSFGSPRPVCGIYETHVNEDRSIMCFSFRPYYAEANKTYSDELVQSSFDREVRTLELIKDYIWAPEVLEIDYSNKRIFFKWYNKCFDLLEKEGADLSAISPTWKDQLEQMVSDLHKEHLYKVSFYPNCFYFDNNGILHTYMFYTVSTYEEQPIDISFYEAMLNEDRLAMIRQLAPSGKLDMALLYEKAFKQYIEWPDNVLPEIYTRVYG